MANDVRPRISLRLIGGPTEDGEIRLDDLSKIARETQALVRGLARGLVGRRSSGRPPRVIEQATALTLVGLHPGSTILEIAAPTLAANTLEAEGMPQDLGPRTLTLLYEAMEAVEGDSTELPVGIDAAQPILPLVGEPPAPSLPFVSPHHQALSGRLYALNLNTGTFSIEDDSGRKIRITVPDDLRDDAAIFINRRVRAVGQPVVDEAGRLTGFRVASLDPQPELEGLDQGEFFDRHDLTPRRAVPVDEAETDDWAIPGIPEEEANNFLTTLSELR